MAAEASVTLRVEKAMMDQIDQLCDRMDRKLRMNGALTRAAVCRMLIDRGMETLGKEYPPDDQDQSTPGVPYAHASSVEDPEAD